MRLKEKVVRDTGSTTRIGEGQRRPGIAISDGVREVVRAIKELLPVAA
jgi:hypothetical protein